MANFYTNSAVGMGSSLAQARNQLTDVVGDVDVLRKATDDVVTLRKRCASLEDEMPADSDLDSPSSVHTTQISFPTAPRRSAKKSR
jgi:hypothetical protein